MKERLLTPSKVTAWLDCEHFLTLQHRVDDGEMDAPEQGMGAFAQLLMGKGTEHEAACLADYEARGVSVHRVPERQPTESFARWVARVGDVLSKGHHVVFQMPFVHDGIRGVADFLERVDHADGSFTYEPVDAKLARADAKPGHVLQLCFYAEAIQVATGTLPELLHVWLGSGQREVIRTQEVRAYWSRLRGRLRALLTQPTAEVETVPVPCRHCQFCVFSGECEATWRDADALHFVAGINRSQRAHLEEGNITTLADLAVRTDDVPGLASDRLHRLRVQADLQVVAREGDEASPPPFVHIEDAGEPPWGHGHSLLPEPDPGDVFLDFEGHPFWRADRGLFFLFGFVAKGDQGEWTYTGRWAHDSDEEALAAKWLVDTMRDRRAAHPGMHVYHYNHTERSGLEALFATQGMDDNDLGVMVREGTFVDLLQVVRNAVQVGTESYGLKHLERLAGFQRGDEIGKGSGAVLEYEAFMGRLAPGERSGQTHDTADELRAIADYNDDDVRATLALRDWLIEVRPDGIDWRPTNVDEEEPDEEDDARVLALRELGGESDLLLADMLGYWQREGRAHSAQLRAKAESDAEKLLIDEDAITGLDGHVVEEQLTPTGRKAKHPGMVMHFPEQSLIPFSSVMYLTEEGGPAYTSVIETDEHERTVTIRYGEDAQERGDRPGSLVKNDYVSPSSKRTAVQLWADQAIEAGGVHVLNDVASQLLERAPARFVAEGGPPAEGFSDDLDAMVDWVDALDTSWLAMQGPPGTGKTYRAARIIRGLILRGKRVGVTAMAHAAIGNLVEATHKVFVEEGDLAILHAIVKPSHVPVDGLAGVKYTASNKDCTSDEFNLVAGTAWLFAGKDMQTAPVDVLLVDEAGQLALVDVVAASVSARNLVLLGDPQQLPQVALASHPGGSGASVLEHALNGAKTLQPKDGIFLGESWRMHPDVCAFISEQFYEGRLSAHASCAVQSTEHGTGLRWLRAAHEGRSTKSPEEVDLIVEEIRHLLGCEWTNEKGEAGVLGVEHFMVVTPYNSQRKALEARFACESGLEGVRVGTVDKFQGQEAPVVFFSAAASSPEEASRGLGFVFNRNRFNVAVSRAKCLAYLVCTNDLLDASASDIEEMKTISTACAFGEALTHGSAVRPVSR